MIRRGGVVIGCVGMLAATLLGCQEQGQEIQGTSPATSPIDEARDLIESGQPDAALARLLTADETPESLSLQGAAWAKKAETAPLPTPTVDADGTTTTPEFKSEELRAIELFERALASRADLAAAHLGLAELLAPHAIRRHEVSMASRRGRRRGRSASATTGANDADPLLRADRIAEHFKQAATEPTMALRALDGLDRFATRMGRLDDRETAYRGLIDHDPENADHVVALGDFLLKERDDPNGAVEQYKQALIWKPEAPEIKSRIAEILIAQGQEAFDAEQWVVAEARFIAAQPWVTEPNSPQGLKVRGYLSKIDSIRRTPQRR